jgi:acyl dehydratase
MNALNRPADHASLRAGQRLPELCTGPVTRATLALYAGASGDHNPNHIDIDFARAAGMPDVFAHGMLVMAYLGRLLTAWVPQERIRRFDVRFVGMTHVGDRISCNGEVLEILEHNGERLARIRLQAKDQSGEVKIQGSALVAC